jgi:hypothetical protein
MLPDEARARREIAAVLKPQSEEMDRWLDLALTLVPPSGIKAPRKPQLDEIVVWTVIGLYAKALKTFRAIQIVSEAGLSQDAIALNRVLFENTLAILFILQRNSRLRARMYHAYLYVKQLRLLRSWQHLKGFKRKAPAADIARYEQAVLKIANGLTGRARWPKRHWYTARVEKAIKDLRRTRRTKINLAAAQREAIDALSAALKKHWSAKTIEDTAKALKWQAAYETFYRYSSSFSHVSDYHKHATLKEDGTIVLRLIPAADDETVRTMETATLFLSIIASEIDKRLKLGKAKALEAEKPRIAARVESQKGKKR